MNIVKKQIELLGPAGSMESLHAAVSNGANAVYLGGNLFNARQQASNFDYKELEEAISYAHLNGVKVYVTVNILIDNSEMEEVLDYIKFLYEIDVDGIIVQDLGLASLVRKTFPQLNVHGSTQMTINNLSGALFLEELGFTRVVLAREIPIEEIKYISENSSIELEYFVHGALCVAYSGQCLMSSLIGGRSGNRGNCAQPCRRPYSVVDNNGNIIDNIEKGYLLSTKDLNTIKNIEEIIDSGISSLKIEGRMKRPEYVAVVVSNYRKALDEGSNKISKNDEEDLEQIFNRGFTKGVGLGDFGKSFISMDRPDNRGTLLGTVTRADKYKVYIKLNADLEEGDGIEFQLSSGEYKGIRAPLSGNKGETITLEKPGHIPNASLVYKTSSTKLLEKAKASYEEELKINPVNMDVKIRIGKKPTLKLTYKEHSINVIGDSVVEKAKKIGLDEDKIYEQLSKLGGTNYFLEDIKIDLDEDSFIALSTLNQLRRNAIDELDSILKNYNNRESIDYRKYENIKKNIFSLKKSEAVKTKRLSIMVENNVQYNQLDINKLDRIYLGFYEGIEEIIIELKDKGKEVYLWTDKILYEKDLNKLDSYIKSLGNQIDGISVSNYGSLKFIKDNYSFKIHGDVGLNVFNSCTAEKLKSVGLKSMTLSPELNLNQISKISNNISADLEAVVYGYTTAMITKTCPMALIKGCKNDKACKVCEYSQGYGLRDRLNMDFYMSRKEGFTTIYNSVPLMVLDKLDDIFASGISTVRLDFTLEKENIYPIQSIYYDYINGIIDYVTMNDYLQDIRKDNNITNGHYFRGII